LYDFPRQQFSFKNPVPSLFLYFLLTLFNFIFLPLKLKFRYGVRYFKIFFPLIITSFVFISCGTSTGSRYDRTESKEKEEAASVEEDKLPSIALKEDFDLGGYKGAVGVQKTETVVSDLRELDIWYGYDETGTEVSSEVEIAAGFRVQIVSTDNLEEANDIRSEVAFRTDQKNIYITFDPPFYRVKAGDFLNRSDAVELSFKLNQMGYPEARVISDSINVIR
jgi:hypothetical protein